ncbi:MAG: nucleotide pyrophosphohydrolase [Nanoarchaeota archaeon]|nr:nucleotide pyrophosphohydrolase [Nanoarchaeota archaeon]MBU1501687.1 nucleotide pyrophosphohydrolase [Nanoarchaeota archaeon]MBU2459004.1 nucleotide pyrophosphohydrolase [Nanoarchaeota archaeon]
MEIKEAQKKVDERINELGGYWSPLSMFARITEELGEVARAMNIKYGEKRSKNQDDERNLRKELGDLQFTLLAIGNKCEIDIEDALLEKMGADHARDKEVYK